MSISAEDLQNAERTIRSAQVLRSVVEKSLILAGAWEQDAVDRVLTNYSESIAVDEDGNVTNVESAIKAYRRENPDAFIELGRVAQNPRLPEMQRFAAAYKDILKARQRRISLERYQAKRKNRARLGVR
jgi:hypothetical protein